MIIDIHSSRYHADYFLQGPIHTTVSRARSIKLRTILFTLDKNDKGIEEKNLCRTFQLGFFIAIDYKANK